MSEILNKRKGLSAETALKIAENLDLDEQERTLFVDLVQAEHARSPESKRAAEGRIFHAREKHNLKFLEEDVFRIISDWHHYAILELTRIKSFKSDIVWIAQRLGISVLDTKLAIERLIRLDLLQQTSTGRLNAAEKQLSSTNGVPSEGLRRFHKQILNRAIDAIQSQQIEERDLSAITMAIDKRKIPKAKEMIKNFRRSLRDFLEKGPLDEVYTVSIQLFRTTK